MSEHLSAQDWLDSAYVNIQQFDKPQEHPGESKERKLARIQHQLVCALVTAITTLTHATDRL